ncbi:hypothetical protein [Brevibacillus laterosporus]|uniref:hypothetical protein n=1 Tax=Brevibacillus laterosporus TaxID=1465 RepID=UPI0003B1C9B5|nr:hypothetical protein [Brevibacillus laterosporus]ERM16650.1 hypothetical protein P615_22640 [Brevibacillus laterosporus PE36]
METHQNANVQGLKKSSILLLTEKLHKAEMTNTEKTNTERELIRSLMVRFIDSNFKTGIEV